MTQFQQVLAEFAPVFKADDVYLLVQRLRHNVIKTGLKKICTSYSRISFKDISMRLHLDSATGMTFNILFTSFYFFSFFSIIICCLSYFP